MKQRPPLYLETSVFGFYHDVEPRNALRRESVRTLFSQIDLGVLHAAVSLLTVEELAGAREPVRAGLLSLVERIERMVVDPDEVDSRGYRGDIGDAGISGGYRGRWGYRGR